MNFNLSLSTYDNHIIQYNIIRCIYTMLTIALIFADGV